MADKLSNEDILADFEAISDEDILADFEEELPSQTQETSAPVIPAEPPREVGTGEAILAGAQEGLLLGGADEAGGLMEVGMDKLAQWGLMPGVDRSPTEVNRELAEQGVTGDIGPTSSGELYDESFQEGADERKVIKEAQPGAYLGGEILGGVVAPGLGAAKLAKGAKTVIGKVAGGAVGGAGAGGVAGALGAEEGERLAGAVVGALGGAAVGGVVGGAGALLSKVIDKGRKLEKQKKEITKMLDPTAPKRGQARFDDDLTIAHDEIVNNLKGAKAATRQEIRDSLASSLEERGKKLGTIRKRDISLSRKDLETTLKKKQIEAGELMKGQDKADYKKALRELYPEAHKETVNKLKSTMKKLDTQEKRVAIKEVMIAEAKSKGELARVKGLERSMKRQSKRRDMLIQEDDALLSRLDKIENGDLSLEQVYNMKRSLKRPGFKGEGEQMFRDIEHKKGLELDDTYSEQLNEYGALKSFVKPSESSVGKFEKVQEGRMSRYIPHGVANKVVKGVEALLPKQEAALKMAGFKPSSRLINGKYRQVLLDALDSGGAEAFSSRLFILQKRDPELRKQLTEEQEEAKNKAE